MKSLEQKQARQQCCIRLNLKGSWYDGKLLIFNKLGRLSRLKKMVIICPIMADITEILKMVADRESKVAGTGFMLLECSEICPYSTARMCDRRNNLQRELAASALESHRGHVHVICVQ
jgi:hypothetical protein